MRPSPSEYFSYFERYVSLVPEEDILAVLTRQVSDLERLFGSLSDQQAGFRYAEGKWSLREVLGHIIDGERVFGYRALCIARGETASLHAFDENRYAEAAGHDQCPLPELIEEFSLLRRSHLLMFNHMDGAAWQRIGLVNENPTSARALAFIMAGHVRHHVGVLGNRYGVAG